MADVLAGEAALVRGLTHWLEDLGGDNDLLARHRQVADRAAENLLADAVGVHVRGVEEVDAGLPGPPVERATRPFVKYQGPPLGCAVGHAPEAQPRYLHAGPSEVDELHVHISRRFAAAEYSCGRGTSWYSNAHSRMNRTRAGRMR